MNESLAAISAQLIVQQPDVEQVTPVNDLNSTDATAIGSNTTATTTELATTKRSSDDGMIRRARPQQHHKRNGNKKTNKNKVCQV
jgi:hypothetical protein